VAKNQILLQLRPAQIELAMLEPELFGGKFLALAARDWNCGSFRRSDNAKFSGPDFDITGFHFRIPHLDGACRDVTLDYDHSLETELSRSFDYRLGSGPRIEGDLNDSGAIAQIEEDDPAEVAGPVHPSAKLDAGTDVRGSQLTSQMGSTGGRETR
jgi:hypothetical protein